jgi:hypothetical protein
MVVIHRIFLALGALASTAYTVHGQNASSPARIWAAAGVGAAAPASGGDGIANMLQVAVEKKSHHFALRGLIAHDIDRSTNELGEIGFLYGRVISRTPLPVTVAAGLSGVGFSACPDDDDSCFTAGAPIVAEISKSTRTLGIGIQAFGNLNSKASYAGAVLFLKLGRLR